MTQASSEKDLPDTQADLHVGFGAVLKREREAQGISLGDMAALSRLSVDQIRALEAEEVESLPSAVYTRAFIRDVCKQLSIEYQPLVDDYSRRFGSDVEGQVPADNPSREVVIGRRNEHRGIKVAGVALIAAVVAVGCWGLYTEFLTPKPASIEAPAAVTEVETPAEVQKPQETVGAKAEEAAPKTETAKTVDLKPAEKSAEKAAEKAPEVKAEEAKAADAKEAEEAKPAAVSAEQKISFRVSEDCWVQIRTIRGQNLIARTVKAGETVKMTIPRGSHFTIGNSRAVEMKVDGEPYVIGDTTRRGIAKFILN